MLCTKAKSRVFSLLDFSCHGELENTWLFGLTSLVPTAGTVDRVEASTAMIRRHRTRSAADCHRGHVSSHRKPCQGYLQ